MGVRRRYTRRREAGDVLVGPYGSDEIDDEQIVGVKEEADTMRCQIC